VTCRTEASVGFSLDIRRLERYLESNTRPGDHPSGVIDCPGRIVMVTSNRESNRPVVRPQQQL
jgi:hypothetical protein